jgi:hypothetical protein
VKVRRGSTVLTSTASALGQYSIDVACSLPGTYNLGLTHPDYASITRLGITVNPNEMVTVDFTGENAVAKADSCEPDCTFPGSNIVQSSCSGVNGCSFFDETTAFVCDNAQSGWTREYDESNVVTCPNGPLAPKPNDKAIVRCEKENVGKATTPVLYNGKTVKMVMVTCG